MNQRLAAFVAIPVVLRRFGDDRSIARSGLLTQSSLSCLVHPRAVFNFQLCFRDIYGCSSGAVDFQAISVIEVLVQIARLPKTSALFHFLASDSRNLFHP